MIFFTLVRSTPTWHLQKHAWIHLGLYGACSQRYSQKRNPLPPVAQTSRRLPETMSTDWNLPCVWACRDSSEQRFFSYIFFYNFSFQVSNCLWYLCVNFLNRVQDMYQNLNLHMDIQLFSIICWKGYTSLLTDFLTLKRLNQSICVCIYFWIFCTTDIHVYCFALPRRLDDCTFLESLQIR
jgi:hypothetical protein